MKGTVLFITGIDTNIGKTFATGMIACALAEKGKKRHHPENDSNGIAQKSRKISKCTGKYRESLSPKRIKPD